MEYLTIALSKGRIAEQASKLFADANLGQPIDLASRKLIFNDDQQKISYIFVKPTDVVTYVANGITDLGIVGRDSILEYDKDVYELFDFGFGRCRLAIAGRSGQRLYNKDEVLRVATKYPNLTKKYFEERKQTTEIIPLNGSVELAPLVGLSDVIVDIVETGNTLRANGLAIIEEMYDVSVRLIANKVSYRFKHERINQLTNILNERLGEEND
jgi:ATP phosphoribosyltransferase